MRFRKVMRAASRFMVLQSILLLLSVFAQNSLTNSFQRSLVSSRLTKGTLRQVEAPL